MIDIGSTYESYSMDNFLDLFLLSMKFYILHFTNFIFNYIFTMKKQEYTLYEMKVCHQEKIVFLC